MKKIKERTNKMKHFFRLSFEELINHKEKKHHRIRGNHKFKVAEIKKAISFGKDLQAAQRFRFNNRKKKLILIGMR